MKTNLFAVSAPIHAAQNGKPDPEIDWTMVRRARPLDQLLLPATQRWATLLPDEMRPTHLIAAYLRIANRLAFAWQDPKAVHDVLDDALIDLRGGRQGFPPIVQAELLRIRALTTGSHSLTLRSCGERSLTTTAR